MTTTGTSKNKTGRAVARKAARNTVNPRLRTKRAARSQVDAIFEQWRRERPDIDPSPVRIYGLVGYIHLQSTAFIDDVLAPFSLVRGTFDVLTALRRAGTPYCLTPKQLTRSLLLSGAGLNSRLNKLESLKYIARLPEPSDRRTVRIHLTATGEAIINDAIPVVFDAQWRRLTPLGEKLWHSLIEDLTRLADSIDSLKTRP
jgi:DNA-binding MarR family transcriptional regulator